jgi:hypothetical protein
MSSSYLRRRRMHPGVLAAVLALGVIAAPPAISAADPVVYPPGAHPFGRSYGQWSAEWWRQAFGVVEGDRAPFESGSVDCSRLGTGQVVFLVGTTVTNTATRSCSIPAGTAILFPLINAECDSRDALTEAKNRSCARFYADKFTNLTATVDGVAVPNLTAFRFQSPVFTFTAAEGNYFLAKAGFYSHAVADGYWLMLAPLRPGTHTVSFGGEAPFFDFSTRATYTLTVKAG